MSSEDSAGSIWQALSRGDLARALELVSGGVDVAACDPHGRTPLMLSAALGSIAMTERLLGGGAPLNAQDRWGLTALSVASLFGQEAVVGRLLEAGANPEIAGPGGLTPVHWAAIFRHTAVLESLHARGARVDAVDAGGYSSLQYAASLPDLDIARCLLAFGADPNLEHESSSQRALKHFCEYGLERPKPVYTALTMALSSRHVEMAMLLLEHGAVATLTYPGVVGAMSGTDHPQLETMLRKATGTELFGAARAGDRDALLLLIGRGASLEGWDEGGATPLHAAIRGGEETCVDTLLLAGAPIDALDRRGLTPIGYAADLGRESLVRMLLAVGADPNAESSDGLSVLYHAVRAGHQDVARLLIQVGASVGLLEAILLGDRDAVKRFLQSGVDLNAASGTGLTPLAAAAVWGDVGMIQLLLHFGARVNADVQGSGTALQVAVDQGHLEAARALLEAGADPNLAKTPHTPLASAVSGNHTSLVRLLLAHGAVASGEWLHSTLLEWAASEGAAEIVEALASAGADPNHGVGLSGTPLLTAVRAGSVDCVRILLRHGARPDDENRWGRTALGIAEADGPPEMVAVLREYGAQVSKNPAALPNSVRRGERLRAPLECLFQYRLLRPPYPRVYPEGLERLLAPALAVDEIQDDLLSNVLSDAAAAPLEALRLLDRLCAPSSTQTAPAP